MQNLQIKTSIQIKHQSNSKHGKARSLVIRGLAGFWRLREDILCLCTP